MDRRPRPARPPAAGPATALARSAGRSRVASRIVALLSCLLVAATTAAAASRPELDRLELDRFEPGVRAVLEEGLARFDADSAAAEPAARADAWGRLGMLYQAHHLQDLAETCYGEAVALDGSSFRWWYFLGFVRQERGAFADAEAAYDRALTIDGRRPIALLRRGQVRAELRRSGPAASDFEAVLALEPENAAALAGLGRLALGERRYEDAIAALGQALAIDPRADRLHYPLAMAYRGSGDLERARTHMARRGDAAVAVRDPLLAEMSALSRSAQIYLEAGYAAARAGRDREAVAQFRKAVEFSPDDPVARLGLGQGLVLLRDYEGAERAFDRAVALAPEDPVARYRRGTLYALTGRDEAAVADLAQATAADPDKLQAGLRLADALMRLGRYSEAALAYQRLSPPPEAAALIRYREGLARLAAGDCGPAAGLFDEALASQPGSGEVMQAIARVDASCADRGPERRARALELARELFAARRDAGHAETLAMAAAANGAFEQAVGLQTQVLAAAGEDAAAAAWHRELLGRYREGRPAEQAWPPGHPVFRPAAGTAGPDRARRR